MTTNKIIQTYSRHEFFVYDRLFSPLDRSEAKSCLVDFIDKAAAALEALHSLGYAHLDVQLQNRIRPWNSINSNTTRQAIF